MNNRHNRKHHDHQALPYEGGDEPKKQPNLSHPQPPLNHEADEEVTRFFEHRAHAATLKKKGSAVF